MAQVITEKEKVAPFKAATNSDNGLDYRFSALYNQGFNPIPIKRGDKKPAIKWQEYQHKYVTPNQCKKWDNSSHNVAIVTGAISGVWVLDIDGEEGLKTFKELSQYSELSGAVRARSGKGFHFYFKYPNDGRVIRNLTSKTARGEPLSGIDVRGEGGFIVVPPSQHANGKIYAWILSPFENEIVDAPEWLLELVTQPNEPTPPPPPLITQSQFSQAYLDAALAGEISTLRNAQVGQRNPMLNAAAFSLGQLISHGLDPANANSQLLSAALEIGLASDEAIATINSGLVAGKRNARTSSILHDSSVSQKDNQKQQLWGEPHLFESINTPCISPDLLPPALGDFARDLARATETPEEMAVACVLGVAAVALTGKFMIAPDRKWHVPLNLYWFIELPPANLKSAVMNACISPIIEWEKSQSITLKPAMSELTSHHKSETKRLDKLRDKYAREEKQDKRESIQQQISTIELWLEMNPVPILPRLFSNNVTPESLENLTYEQGGIFAVITDEGGVLETLTGLYSNGRANVDMLLKGIDGGDMRIKRKDRDLMMNPYLTFILCVQPVIREKMSHNQALHGNGALERFLYVIPKSKIGYRKHNQSPVCDMTEYAYHRVITELLNIDYPVDEYGNRTPQIITLSPEAYHALQAFKLWLEPRLKPEGDLTAIQGWAAKLAGYAVRIAGLLHVVKTKGSELQMNITEMETAIEIAKLLLEHAKVAFQLMGVDETIKHAQYILQWLQIRRINSIPRAKLTSEMRNKLKAKQIDAAIDELASRNIIMERTVSGQHTKPITYYDVNPAVYADSTPLRSNETYECSSIEQVKYS